MNTQDIHLFINRLQELAGGGNPARRDRASLATLRRGISKPEDDYRIVAIIGRLLPDHIEPNEYVCYAHVASLFAINPHDMNDGTVSTIGAAARTLRNSLPGVGEKSLDLQFSAILDSNVEDLIHYLRHMVHRLASAPTPIRVNYRRLLIDLITLRSGESGERRTRRNWALQYWNAFNDRRLSRTDQSPETEERPI